MKAKAQRRRHNSVASAAALSEAFHGRPAETVTEYVEAVREHSTLADFGKLLALYITDIESFDKRLKPGECIKIEYRGTRLAFSESGTQAYMVGGDQSLDLVAFPWADRSKESVWIGNVAFIEYETAKFHLGKEDQTPGPYVHHFSEESKGLYPQLAYDTVNELGAFVGGSYYVKRDMDGKYSAGIRD